MMSSISSENVSVSSENDWDKRNAYTFRKLSTVLVICFINLINFMDRYTIPGIMTNIQEDFKINDIEGGLLQSAFVISYLVFAPIIGYFGDRYSRRLIMAIGICIWSIITLVGSFMQSYGWFVAIRALGGIGEASYSAIGPAIISDLFIGDHRSKMLALFYFTTPVGGGLGFIVGSALAAATNDWHWGLRVAPIAGLLAVLLVLILVQDPVRGESEGTHLIPTTWMEDVKYLARNPSFMLSTIGSVGVTFTAGAVASWGPKFYTLGLQYKNGNNNVSMDDVSLIFGLTTVPAGVIGVISGSLLGQKLRIRFPTADAVICGLGLVLSAPLFYGSLVLADQSFIASIIISFFAQWLLNLNWALCGDILLYVVIPTRRATAEAFQILVCHVFGDAGSPYIIGQVSELIKSRRLSNTWSETGRELLPSKSWNATVIEEFTALEYSLYIAVFVELLGGFFFLACSWYLIQDRAKAEHTTNNDLVASSSETALTSEGTSEIAS